MYQSVRKFIPLSLLIMIMLLMQRSTLFAKSSETAVTGESMPGNTVYLMHDPISKAPAFVPPPTGFSQRAPQNATITVNYIGSWDGAAQNAFQYAVDIWETLISSPVTIVVEAEWGPLGAGVLGGAGPQNYYRDFTGAPTAGTWYAVALANSLAGTDLDPANGDISAIFNSDFSSWYFGTDGNTPGGQIDFVSVVLHEIGHGLGFAGSMTVSGGSGSWGAGSGFPFSYDRFAENGSGASLVNDFPNNSSALANQLTSNNILFDGPNTTAANGSPAELYAPSSWAQGSSFSHLGESFNGTPNALMTFAINNGEANHNPGPVGLAVLQDTGWTVKASNTAPVIAGLIDHMLEVNSSLNNATDLYQYTSDAESADADLTFTLTNAGDANAGITLDSGRYIDINPAGGWTGTTTATVEVEDPDGLTDSDSFTVFVVDNILSTFLPATMQNN